MSAEARFLYRDRGLYSHVSLSWPFVRWDVHNIARIFRCRYAYAGDEKPSPVPEPDDGCDAPLLPRGCVFSAVPF